MKNPNNTTQLVATVKASNNLASVLDYSKLKNAALITKTKALDKWTAANIQNEKDKNGYYAEQARVLDSVSSSKLYKADGFNSLTEYAEAVGLFKTGTVSPSKLSQLAAAGRVYNDPKAPEALRRTAPFALSGAQGSINNDAKRAELYKRAAEYERGLTQDEARKMNAAIAEDMGNAKTGKPVKVYNAMLNGVVIKDNAAAPCKPEDWAAWAEAQGYEVIPVKAQGEYKRLVCIKGNAAKLLTMGESINKAATEAAKNAEYKAAKTAERNAKAAAKKAAEAAKAKAKAETDTVAAKAKAMAEAKAKAKVKAAAEAVAAKAAAELVKAAESVKA